MGERKCYSVEEVLSITIGALQEINVPVGLTDTVAVPIRNCIGNLQICMEAIAQEKAEARAAADARKAAEEETEAEEDGPGAGAE